jgi:hypothetical protein
MNVYYRQGKVEDIRAHIVTAYWKVELQFHAFKTITLHSGEWSAYLLSLYLHYDFVLQSGEET